MYDFKLSWGLFYTDFFTLNVAQRLFKQIAKMWGPGLIIFPEMPTSVAYAKRFVAVTSQFGEE